MSVKPSFCTTRGPFGPHAARISKHACRKMICNDFILYKQLQKSHPHTTKQDKGRYAFLSSCRRYTYRVRIRIWCIFGAFFLSSKQEKPPLSVFRRGFWPKIKRRERDSNSRYPFGVHTLSRRASSATRASLQYVSGAFRSKPDCKGSKKIRKSHKTVKILWDFPKVAYCLSM